jgi:hypothetical protein
MTEREGENKAGDVEESDGMLSSITVWWTNQFPGSDLRSSRPS